MSAESGQVAEAGGLPPSWWPAAGICDVSRVRRFVSIEGPIHRKLN